MTATLDASGPRTGPPISIDLEPDRLARLTRTERSDLTAELLGRACRDDTAAVERRDLLDLVVRINMPVAQAVSRRYRSRGIADDDLEQVAYLALTRAAQKFDPRHHTEFLSYAMPTMLGELRKHFRDHGWAVRPPRRVQELRAEITAARDELFQRVGRSPRPSELAQHLGIEEEDIVEALASDGAYAPTSLDRPVGTADPVTAPSLGETLGGEADGVDAVEARVLLAPLVSRLGDRDRRILALRFFEQRTQQEIADDIGVTQMHVSRLLGRILGQLRAQLD